MKWGGAAVTVLLVVVWIASKSWYLRCFGADSITIVHLGALTRWVGGASGPQRFYMSWDWGANTPHEILWWFRNEPGFWCLPLWVPALIALILTVPAWRLDTLARRRARVGFCPKCNYDRTGLAAGAVCPECGTAARSTQTEGTRADSGADIADSN